MANQAGVTKRTIYDVHFERQRPAQQVVPVLNVARRFEARKQGETGSDEFWCVWDTLSDTQAFGGALTYLTQADAMARAEELCANTQP